MGVKRDNRKLQSGSCYHIYNRGNRKQEIALEQEDYQAYMHYLEYNSKRFRQELFSYCIMPNHFHLLVMVKDPTLFMKFMNCFSASCARFYNKKYKSVGHLFQDKYKHREIEDKIDLAYTVRYIHRNPLDLEGIDEKNLMNYPYSSFGQYCGLDFGNKVNCELILNLFKSENYLRFVLSKNFSEQILTFRDRNFFYQDITRLIEKRLVF